jgi:hypothetical protein
MPNAQFVDHDGTRILLIDFSRGSGPQSIVETSEEAMRLVRSVDERRSVRGLIDLSGTSLNKVVRGSMRRMSRNNGPYMRSVAFVGPGLLLSPLFKGLLFVTGRSNHRVFRARQDALDWLARN